ncbi:hypothetical protein SAMN05216436_105229 [bacterium A37T11]|nr:hypothetical protein SAMN05216436_105229 [bacterium A37T11]
MRMTNTVNNEGLSAKDLMLAFIVSFVLMFLAGSGFAQGIATAKAADATEVVSPAKEVKSAIVVSAKLAKAMEVAKTTEKKKAGQELLSKKQNYVYFYYDNNTYTPAAYIIEGNWAQQTNPTDCGGSAHICVLQVDESLLSTDPGLSMEEKLNQYLTSLYDDDPSSVTDFVNDNAFYSRN